MSGHLAVETEKWGRSAARERYGQPQHENGAPPPKDESKPQRLGDSGNLRGKNTGSVPSNSWIRGGGAGGEGNPSYRPGATQRQKRND
jgi:hypothetical protein